MPPSVRVTAATTKQRSGHRAAGARRPGRAQASAKADAGHKAKIRALRRVTSANGTHRGRRPKRTSPGAAQRRRDGEGCARTKPTSPPTREGGIHRRRPGDAAPPPRYSRRACLGRARRRDLKRRPHHGPTRARPRKNGGRHDRHRRARGEVSASRRQSRPRQSPRGSSAGAPPVAET